MRLKERSQPPSPEQLVQGKPAHEAFKILERQIERWNLKAAAITMDDHPDQDDVKLIRETLEALRAELTIQQARLVEMN
jgi:hypothetical protein